MRMLLNFRIWRTNQHLPRHPQMHNPLRPDSSRNSSGLVMLSEGFNPSGFVMSESFSPTGFVMLSEGFSPTGFVMLSEGFSPSRSTPTTIPIRRVCNFAASSLTSSTVPPKLEDNMLPHPPHRSE